jgi:hypothetical protein
MYKGLENISRGTQACICFNNAQHYEAVFDNTKQTGKWQLGLLGLQQTRYITQ